MDHAVGAFLIIADPVGVPVGLVHQFVEGLRIAFAEQIAGPLPAEDGARRVAPGGAVIGLVPGQEVEEQARLVERPLACAVAPAEHRAEQLLRRRAVEEMLLVRGALIGVAGRNGDPVHAEFRDRIEEGGDALRVRVIEEGAVDGDAEAFRLGGLERLDRAVVDAGLADGPVVHLLVAVEVDRPGEVGAWAVLIDLLLEQQRVGADDREFLARNDALDDLCQISVQERLAARHDDHRRAAFIDRGQRVLNRDTLVENGVGIVDLAAAGASEVAAEQRLEHQHERIALAAGQVLPDDIGADSCNLSEWYAHGRSLKISKRGEVLTPGQFRSSAGRRKLTVSAGPSRTDTSDGASADKA